MIFYKEIKKYIISLIYIFVVTIAGAGYFENVMVKMQVDASVMDIAAWSISKEFFLLAIVYPFCLVVFENRLADTMRINYVIRWKNHMSGYCAQIKSGILNSIFVCTAYFVSLFLLVWFKGYSVNNWNGIRSTFYIMCGTVTEISTFKIVAVNFLYAFIKMSYFILMQIMLIWLMPFSSVRQIVFGIIVVFECSRKCIFSNYTNVYGFFFFKRNLVMMIILVIVIVIAGGVLCINREFINRERKV